MFDSPCISASLFGDPDCPFPRVWRPQNSTSPELPQPSYNQYQWRKREMEMFLHFGVNTYTGREWGLGDEDPNIFQPKLLNTTQWVETAKNAGFGGMILVSKHHDGFMLFPNSYTKHTVASSSWRQGKGDVVADFVSSCKQLDMGISFYLSPWDRNFFNMTWKPEYNQFYENTFQVLSSSYGKFGEIWWDGANAVPNRTHLYDWHTWMDILNKNQPEAVGGGCGGVGGVRDCGPDTVWVGNEGGKGNEEQWGFSKSSVEFPSSDPDTLVWGDVFCDVSIRPGWFYHEKENNKLKTLKQLVEIYFRSVGWNCMLQLNVPPNKDGLLENGDVLRIKEFGTYIKNTFSQDFALNGHATATSVMCGSSAEYAVDGLDTYWIPDYNVSKASLTVRLLKPMKTNVVMMQEHIPSGQVISSYTVEIQSVGKTDWTQVAKGTTIGYKKLNRFPDIIASSVRFSIKATKYDYGFALQALGLFYAKPL